MRLEDVPMMEQNMPGPSPKEAAGPAPPRIDEVKVPPLVIARRPQGGGVVRYGSIADVPSTMVPITEGDVEAMPMGELAKLYGDTMCQEPKRWGDRRVLLESLVMQVFRLPKFDPANPRKVPEQPAPRVKREVDKAGRDCSLEVADMSRVPGLPPQARELVAMVAELSAAAGGGPVLESALVSELGKPKARERLRTRQETVRIWYYYRSRLRDSGAIRFS